MKMFTLHIPFPVNIYVVTDMCFSISGAQEPGPQFEKDSLVAVSEQGQDTKKHNLEEVNLEEVTNKA